jgi:HD-GYP domain-containing protein (c-di-GMP phosphodiesterase class II)
MPAAKAIAELKRCAGTQFDPAVVRAFLKTPIASSLRA